MIDTCRYGFIFGYRQYIYFNIYISRVFFLLQQVITNEHVVAMVRNTILNEVTSKDELKEAAYEPKMTRAKVKKAIEEKGDVRKKLNL